MRDRIPHEITASLLAATTAFIGGTALHLPPWAIFISWAGTFLIGKPSLANAKRLWATMPVGSAYALIIVLLDQRFGTILGTNQLSQNIVLAAIILVINTLLMFTGRLKPFALIPGMFFGFACYFATFFGGFGFAPGNPWAVWVSVVVMNAFGPILAYLSVKLAFPRSVENQKPPVAVAAPELAPTPAPELAPALKA
jgi:hypothetical protein